MPNIKSAKNRYAAATENGKKGGRPRKDIDIDRVLELESQEKTQAEIAEIMGVSKNTIANRLREHKNQKPTQKPKTETNKNHDKDIDIDKDIEERKERNIKERKEKTHSLRYEDILSSVSDNGLRELYFEYIKMRKMIKAPMTNRALSMLIERVNDIEPLDVERRKKMLEEAIVNNWQMCIRDRFYRGIIAR